MLTKTKAFGLAALGLCLPLSVAHAAPVYQFEVWTGAPNGVDATTLADQAHQPTGKPSATYLYNGTINFNSTDPNNTAGSFMGGGGSITGFASPRGTYASLNAFLKATLSTSGDTIDSFFRITGTYSSATSLPGQSVTHDDGASLYVNNQVVFTFPAETSSLTNTFTLPSGSNSFVLDYVEANGAPSVLDIVFPDSVRPNVPEPASLALLGGGLVALGLRRAGRRGASAAA